MKQSDNSNRVGYRAISRTTMLRVAVGAAALAAFGMPDARAANTSWSTTPANGFFSGTNWTPGAVPGLATTTVTSTDALFFGTSTVTTLNNDLSGYTFAGLTFIPGAAAFTIGGNAFTLSGGITNNSTSTQTINNNIALSATQVINTAAGNVTLGGGVSGTGFGITKTGTGTLTLSTANTYTGTTSVNGGTLALNFAAAGAPTTNIIAATSPLALAGGTLSVTGNTGATNSQAFASTVFNAGGSGITLVPNGATALSVNLGAITRATGGSTVFTPSTGTISGSATLTNGIIGPWAIVSNAGTAANNSTAGYTFATITGGNVVAYTGATAVTTGYPASSATTNYDVSATGTQAMIGTSRAANTIRFTGTAAYLQQTNSAQTETVNGIMNAGGGTFSLGVGGVTFSLQSATGDLVLAAMTNGIVIGGPIINNGATAGAVTVVGAGSNTVTLSGTNTFTGGLFIGSGGTVVEAVNTNLGGAAGTAGAVSLNGGTLRTTVGLTNTHPITIGAAGGTINVFSTGSAGSGQYFFNTVNTLLGSGALNLTGSGTLQTTGAGNLRIGQTNTYSGNATIQSGGIFEYGVAGAVGAGATFTIGNQGELVANSGVTLPNAVSVTGGTNSVLSFENGNAGVFSGPIALSATGTVGLRDWYNNATVRSGTISGVISGAGGLTVNSGTGTGGTLTLTGASTYTGATTLSAANLVIDHSGSNTGALGNTAVTAGANAVTVRGNAAIGNGAGAQLSVGNGTAGTLSLVDTTINTLSVGGALTFNAASLNFELGGNGTTGTADAITSGGAATVSGTTINLALLSGQTLTSGSYTLIAAASGLGAGFTLGTKPAGFNSYSLDSSTATAEILTVTANASSAVEYWTGKSSAANADTTPYKWGFGATLAVPASNWSTDAAGLNDALQVPGSNTDTYFTATNALPNSGTSLLTQLDASYAVKGLFFDTSSQAAASPGSAITLVSVDLNGNSLTIGANGLTLLAATPSAITISGTGSVVLGGSQTWTNASASDLTVASTIANTGTLTINNTGTGRTILSGTNTYAGATAVSAGTLKAGSTGGLSANSAVTIANVGATLDITGFNSTIGSLAGGGTVTLGSATLTTGANGGTTTFAGVVSGSGGLTKSGAGTFSLTGVNAYTGTTTISAGVLQVGDGTTDGSITASANIVDNATLVYNRTNGSSFTYGGVISGTGIVTKAGAGTQTLTGANTFTNNLFVKGGTLVVDSGGSISNTNYISIGQSGTDMGFLTLQGTGMLTTTNEFNVGDVGSAIGVVNITDTAKLTANALFIGSANTTGSTATGTINQSGGTVTQVSTGIGVFSIGGRITGATGTGTYNISGGSLIANGGIRVGDFGAGNFNQTGGVVNAKQGVNVSRNSGTGVYNLNGGTLAAFNVTTSTAGSSTFNFNGGTLQAGTTLAQSGAAAIVPASAFFSGLTRANVRNGGAIIDTLANIVTVAQPLLHSNVGGDNAVDGGVTKNSAGTLILTGASTYTGPTTIAGGILQLGNGTTGNDGTIANTSGIINNGSLVYNRFGSASSDRVISGAGTVTKLGAGKQILTGANTYTGGTTITAGTLVADSTDTTNGSTGSGAVAVNTGGTLAGGSNATVGQVKGTVEVASGATITAGSGSLATDSIGVLSSGAQTWNRSGTYAIKVASAGTFDTLTINGLLSLTSTGDAGNKFTLSVINTALGAFVPGSYKIASATSISTTAGAVTTSGTDLTNLFALNIDGVADTLSNDFFVTAGNGFGSAGDLYLNYEVSATPEPTTALLFGIAGFPLLTRRRRRAAQVA